MPVKQLEQYTTGVADTGNLLKMARFAPQDARASAARFQNRRSRDTTRDRASAVAAKISHKLSEPPPPRLELVTTTAGGGGAACGLLTVTCVVADAGRPAPSTVDTVMAAVPP